jgi:hypothetical protein
MSTYEYPPLSIELQSFRLLCLLPAENESTKTTRIRCRLAEYSLQDSGKSIPLYDALSYTWDGPAKPRSIFINEQKLAVTENLYAALLQIRDRGLNQIIWIDALCINQADTEERGQQVCLWRKSIAKQPVYLFGWERRQIIAIERWKAYASLPKMSLRMLGTMK